VKELWDHQRKAIDDALAALQSGDRRLCLTSPTGGGKSRIMCEIIAAVVERWDWQAVIYTNRLLLLEQLVGVLKEFGIEAGVRASGYETSLNRPVQISSIQTETARGWTPHGEGANCLAVVDEAHLNAGPSMQEILAWHVSRGHATLGMTATPIGVGHLYDKLIVAGTNSELRQCGALVLAKHYGPDEPDFRALKNYRENYREGEDLSEGEARKNCLAAVVLALPDAHSLRGWARQLLDRRPQE
jgi:superfamily II DNA or RNA helicase